MYKNCEKYVGIGCETGKEVPLDEALSYAMLRCGIPVIFHTPESSEFIEMLVEWYFSGNWLHVSS